ncbi:hypothetical protein GCM10023093_20940 [Nemorincola caseinilytica]|uniref:Secretion system C-terminal sorting domain-containing protein n=2 Tax=Nemorincola caseinilytica TaxID=2054315 RepID=A0ABP8NIW4_9BACT
MAHALDAQIITTVAGGGSAGLGDGGAATNCQLYEPSGITTDAAGNMYIADRASHRIRKVNTAGIVSTIAGTGIAGYLGDNGPATLAKLAEPIGIAIDAAGNIFFSEVGNSCVRKINTAGIITTIAGNGTMGYSGTGGPATNAQLSGPGYIALDAAGNIYIPEYDNHCVRKVDVSTGLISLIAGTNISGYSGDDGPATDAKMRSPQAVALDGLGNMYIADYTDFRIRKVDPSGIITTVAGTGMEGYNGDNIMATAADIKKPVYLATDNSNNVYISDTYNYRVRKISSSGIISTIAGQGVGGFSGDNGLATGAKFQGITGLKIDLAGNVFVSDAIVNRVRRISAPVKLNVVQRSGPDVRVYPNPSSGHFMIRINSDMREEALVRVVNAMGSIITEMHIPTDQAMPIDLDVPTGIYLLSVWLNGTIATEKINVIR